MCVHQTCLLKNHKTGNQGNLGGNHHGAQIYHKDNTAEFKCDLRKSIRLHGRYRHLQQRGQDGYFNRIQIIKGKIKRAVPRLPIVHKIWCPRYKSDWELKHLPFNFEGGGNHPQQRQNHRQRQNADYNGKAYAYNNCFLFFHP